MLEVTPTKRILEDGNILLYVDCINPDHVKHLWQDKYPNGLPDCIGMQEEKYTVADSATVTKFYNHFYPEEKNVLTYAVVSKLHLFTHLYFFKAIFKPSLI